MTALARPIIDPAPVPGELERLIREQARDRAENHARLRFAGGPLLECDIIPPNGHANGKAGLDILADPSCHDPAEACEAAEAIDQALDGPKEGRGGWSPLLIPLVLLGSTLPGWRPWTETARAEGHPCPVCGSRRKEQIEVCAGCLESGVNRLLDPVSDDELPRPAPAHDPGELAGGTGPSPRDDGTIEKALPIRTP